MWGQEPSLLSTFTSRVSYCRPQYPFIYSLGLFSNFLGFTLIYMHRCMYYNLGSGYEHEHVDFVFLSLDQLA